MITRFTDKQKKHINKLEVIQYKNSKLTIHLNYLQLQKKTIDKSSEIATKSTLLKLCNSLF